jgi:molybdopterin-synthase adenylyltransferase
MSFVKMSNIKKDIKKEKENIKISYFNKNFCSSNKSIISRSEGVIGKDGLDKIHNSKIAIVGTGGLGSYVCTLLARMQPKEMIIIDFDVVDESNLERQTLFEFKDINKNKVKCAKSKLSNFCKITAHNARIDKNNISKLIPKDVDLVMDCVDNTIARLAINEFCKNNKINWIHAGVVQQTGILAFINNSDNSKENTTGCFKCFNQEKQGKKALEIGVLNSVVAVIGSMSTNIAINYLANGNYPKELIRVNLSNYSILKLKYKKGNCCI